MSETVDVKNADTEVTQWVTDTKAYCEISYTRQPRNFESVRVTVGLGRPLKEGEHPQKALDMLYDQITTQLSKQVADTKEQIG